MCATAADLIEHVLPRVALRQWVLTFPFRWRRRLAQDGELLGHLSRLFVSTVQAFYGGKTGSMMVVHPFGYHEARQRTSSDLRLNPHLRVVFLDGSYQDGTSPDAEFVWREHGHLQTRDFGRMLEATRRRMHRWLRRRDALQSEDEGDDSDGAEANLAASAVSGHAPPALEYDKPLCVSLDGFTLPPSGDHEARHAATRAGAMDDPGREALLRYVLRPPVAQERVSQKPDGLVRITLKRAYQDGTVAVEMDPLSLLCRLATSVPPPRFHTVKYAGGPSFSNVRIAANPPRATLVIDERPTATPRRKSRLGPCSPVGARAR